MTAAEWLARARAVTDGATPGPWVHNGVNGVHTLIGSCVATTQIHEDQRRWEDAAFIAASRTLLPAAVAAIEAVLVKCAETNETWLNRVQTGDDRDDRWDAMANLAEDIEAAITAALDAS